MFISIENIEILDYYQWRLAANSKLPLNIPELWVAIAIPQVKVRWWLKNYSPGYKYNL